MEFDENVFKLRIKEILIEKGISSKELALRMGKAPQYVSNIINGGKGISVSTLIEIAKALKVEFKDLFDVINKDNSEELTALIEHKGEFYKANTIEELRKIVSQIEEKQENS